MNHPMLLGGTPVFEDMLAICTDQFLEGMEELPRLASSKQSAFTCAEAVPWRCHRSLVGDALLVRGVEVIDIFSLTKSEPEKVTSFAKVDGTAITYPPSD